MRWLPRAALFRTIAVALVLAGASTATASADPVGANAALLDKYFADVNARDLAALKDVISDEYVQHGAYQGQGLAGMQAAFQHYFEMFPDFHWTVENSVITHDKVVALFRVTATHDHTVQLAPGAPAFPPTGNKLSWEGISIWRVADGKFVEHWDIDDLLSLAQQMRAQTSGAAK